MKKTFIVILAIACTFAGYLLGRMSVKKQTAMNSNAEKAPATFIDEGVDTVANFGESISDINYSEDSYPVAGVIPENGLVPDAETAALIARPVLNAVFGKEQIDRELPLRVTLCNDSVWSVGGTLHTTKGGVASMTITKKKGIVKVFKHGE